MAPMKRRIIALLLTAALLVAPAACGQKKEDTASEGTPVSFETTDLEGNPVKSEDVFSRYTLTMVNILGTYCGPCIAEMPDLAELSARLEGKNCGVLGVVYDVSSPEAENMEEAKTILSEGGVTYMNLLPWESVDRDFPCQFIPTSFFVDSSGRIVGETVIGSHSAEEYEAIIDELLKAL